MKTCKSKLWIWIAVPVVLGMLSGWLSSLMAGGFDTFQKPAFTPPDWVFPVVWTIPVSYTHLDVYKRQG